MQNRFMECEQECVVAVFRSHFKALREGEREAESEAEGDRGR